MGHRFGDPSLASTGSAVLAQMGTFDCKRMREQRKTEGPLELMASGTGSTVVSVAIAGTVVILVIAGTVVIEVIAGTACMMA